MKKKTSYQSNFQFKDREGGAFVLSSQTFSPHPCLLDVPFVLFVNVQQQRKVIWQRLKSAKRFFNEPQSFKLCSSFQAVVPEISAPPAPRRESWLVPMFSLVLIHDQITQKKTHTTGWFEPKSSSCPFQNILMDRKIRFQQTFFQTVLVQKL